MLLRKKWKIFFQILVAFSEYMYKPYKDDFIHQFLFFQPYWGILFLMKTIRDRQVDSSEDQFRIPKCTIHTWIANNFSAKTVKIGVFIKD